MKVYLDYRDGHTLAFDANKVEPPNPVCACFVILTDSESFYVPADALRQLRVGP